MLAETIVITLLMAVIYAILGVAKSVDEEFKPSKAGASILLGLFIGIVMYASGMPVTRVGVAEQMAMYGGLIYVIENFIKAIVRRLKRLGGERKK